MDIIKDAFEEGRDTDTPWLESNAIKNKLKLDIAIENYSMQKERRVGDIIRIAKIDPDSGKTLQIFNSRLQAAQHIVKDILKRPNKNPISITGNMAICMAAGWKSYGFYWKILSEKEYMLSKKKDGSHSIIVVNFNSPMQNAMIYSSIRETSKALDIAESTIRNALKSKKYLKNYSFRYVNETPKTLIFDDYKTASHELGIGLNRAKKLAHSGESYNNCSIRIRNIIPCKYQIYKNNEKFNDPVSSLREATKLLNFKVTSDHVSTGRAFGSLKQYSIRSI